MFLILQIVNNYALKSPAHEQDFFSKYISLLSPIIVIVTFVINNRYTSKTKKAESERAWYFKAYFETQIKKVEEFFLNADNLMKTSLTSYEISQSTFSEIQKLEFVGGVLLGLADSKRKFEIEVLEILKYSYPKIFIDVELNLMDFEDAGAKVFEDNPKEDPYFKYLSDINKIKAKLIKSLSGPALAT